MLYPAPCNEPKFAQHPGKKCDQTLTCRGGVRRLLHTNPKFQRVDTAGTIATLNWNDDVHGACHYISNLRIYGFDSVRPSAAE